MIKRRVEGRVRREEPQKDVSGDGAMEKEATS
jgi:hypothetical protein